MADFNLFGRFADGAGGIGKEDRLLVFAHQTEKQAGLGVVVLIILAEVPVVGGTIQRQRRFRESRLLLPLAIAVGLIAKGAAVTAIREIAVKGDQARFRKTERGHFELTAAGKEVA